MDTKGLTLIEIIIVLVILGILGLIGLPKLTQSKYNLDLKGAARNIASAVSLAKMESFKGEPILLDISVHQLKLCVDNNQDGVCDRVKYVVDLPGDIDLNADFSGLIFDKGIPHLLGTGVGPFTLSLLHNKTQKTISVIISKTGRVRISG